MITRQKYKDMQSPTDIYRLDIDLIQLKYDGIWALIIVKDSIANLYSRTGNLKTTFETCLPTGTYIGEYMYGTEWAQQPRQRGLIYLFDYLHDGHYNLTNEPYCIRMTALSTVLKHVDEPNVRLVKAYFITQYDAVLSYARNSQYEGLVFRKSTSPYNTTLYRYKFDVEGEFYAIAFYPGTPGKRNEHTLGAIGVAESSSGPELMHVGGGFTDSQRNDIWQNQDEYLNRLCEITGKKVFASGAFRHPNFKRWV